MDFYIRMRWQIFGDYFIVIHIIDISGSINEKGEQVNPLSYNPENDVLFLENELDMWFFQIIKKGWDKFLRQVRMERQEPYRSVAKQLSGLGVDENIAEEVSIESYL